MAWIKKNLVFVICSAVALVLLGVAGWMLFSNMGRDTAIQEELNQELANWQSLNSGSFPSQENIDAANKEKEKLLEVRKQSSSVVPLVSAPPQLSDQQFVNLLGTKIAELRTRAEQAGVALPEEYDFTFSAQRKSLNFPAGSIESWVPQLNDIEGICNVLFRARVNALENLQRVPVSPLDAGTTEFLQGSVVSNEFAVYTPYQVTFRGFSAELAAVLEQAQTATNFIVIKSISVGPSSYEPGASQDFMTPVAPVRRVAPTYSAPVSRGPTADELALLGGGGGKGGGAPQRQYTPRPVYRRAPVRAPSAGAAETVLAEGPLQVTLLLDVVKLNPAQ